MVDDVVEVDVDVELLVELEVEDEVEDEVVVVEVDVDVDDDVDEEVVDDEDVELVEVELEVVEDVVDVELDVVELEEVELEVVVKLKFDFNNCEKENSAIVLRIFSYYNFHSSRRTTTLHHAPINHHVIPNRLFDNRSSGINDGIMSRCRWGGVRPIGIYNGVFDSNSYGISTSWLNFNPLSPR